MTEEKVEYKQINVLVPKKDLEELDKLVRESKFNSRSEYVRYLIENELRNSKKEEEIYDNLRESKRILDGFRSIKEPLKTLFEEANMDPELKKEALAVLTREEERG